MAWIHKIYADDPYVVGAYCNKNQLNKPIGQVKRYEVSEQKVEDFEATYENYFSQVYIVSCSGC